LLPRGYGRTILFKDRANNQGSILLRKLAVFSMRRWVVDIDRSFAHGILQKRVARFRIPGTDGNNDLRLVSQYPGIMGIITTFVYSMKLAQGRTEQAIPFIHSS
jgi:hypothetical protein